MALRALLAAVILLAGCSSALAQEAMIGAGRLEIGGFPGGGTFFVGGDDNTEVNFNVYTAGGGLTYYFTEMFAVEGEFTGSVGWAQDVVFEGQESSTIRCLPSGDISEISWFFPGGAVGKRTPFYLTGGIGAVCAVTARADQSIRLRRRHGRHPDVHCGKHRRRHQDFPRCRRGELGLPDRLSLSLREREQRRAGVFCRIQEPRRAPDLRRYVVYLETVKHPHTHRTSGVRGEEENGVSFDRHLAPRNPCSFWRPPPRYLPRPMSASCTSSVVDKNGEPILDLTAKDFIVREDGQAREILRVVRDNDPLQVALLIDNSVAMRPRLPQLRNAVSAFIDATREDVPLALITLAERPTIAAGYTTDRAELRKSASSLFAYESGNYLLDGIAETSQGLAKRTMWRSAIAVITGLGPELSYRQYTEVLRFFREGGASLHVLQLGMGVGEQGREIVVSKGTSETGGRFEEVLAPQALERKARQLATEISNQYRVTYARPVRLIPPKSTDVSVRRSDLRARSVQAKTDR